jgi:hypothetical protein
VLVLLVAVICSTYYLIKKARTCIRIYDPWEVVMQFIGSACPCLTGFMCKFDQDRWSRFPLTSSQDFMGVGHSSQGLIWK